jgi:hypothetical protein
MVDQTSTLRIFLYFKMRLPPGFALPFIAIQVIGPAAMLTNLDLSGSKVPSGVYADFLTGSL